MDWNPTASYGEIMAERDDEEEEMRRAVLAGRVARAGKEKAKEIEPDYDFEEDQLAKLFYGEDDLEDVVEMLLDAKERGENVYYDYVNAHASFPSGTTAPKIRFYSADITMDDAYMKVYGCTKAEFDKQKQAKQQDDDGMTM